MSSISLAQDPTPSPTVTPTPFVPVIPTPAQTVTLQPITFYLDPKTTSDLQNTVFTFLASRGANIPTIPDNQMILQYVGKKSTSDLSMMVTIYYTQYPQ